MFLSLFGVQGTFGYADPEYGGFGADWSSQSAIPNQNAGCSWKFQVPPLPSCWGITGGSLGSESR